MNKLKLLLFSICLIFTLSGVCFAGRFEKSGEYYRYFENDGVVARDKIVEYDRESYYVNNEGYVVFNSWVQYDGKYYYAGSDGKIKKDGVYDIEGYKYNLDVDGSLKKGWSNDHMYYGDEEDGFLVNGFQELSIPKDWITEENKEKTGWFYFDTDTCKRVFSEDEPYVCKMIGNRKYCFDQNGILRTGWRLIKDTEPVMKGYMYFVEESTDEFKFGEAVTDSWYSIEPPTEVLPSSEVRYFYFNGQGQPRTAPVGKYSKVRLADKTYLFNEYGYAVYGVHELNGEYYYFGDSTKDCSMKVGLINKNIDNSDGNASFYFLDNGEGYTGVKNNKLYYKGKLQMASTEQKYAGVQIRNVVYLVNTSGTVMKNKKKLKDGDDCEWWTNSAGVVTKKDEEADYVLPEPPSLSEDK